jgi:hypothetical protein
MRKLGHYGRGCAGSNKPVVVVMIARARVIAELAEMMMSSFQFKIQILFRIW